MKSRSNDGPGAVYILAHESWPGYYKVGSAINPHKRLATYQCGCPHHGYRMVSVVWVPLRFFVEAGAHSILHQHRRCGEWFRAPLAVVFGAIIQSDARRPA